MNDNRLREIAAEALNIPTWKVTREMLKDLRHGLDLMIHDSVTHTHQQYVEAAKSLLQRYKKTLEVKNEISSST